jgi:hypothetical protein
MIPYLPLRPGKGFRPLPAALYAAQRLVVGRRLRGLVSRTIAATVRGREGPGKWPAAAPGYRAELHANGIVGLPGFPDPALVAAAIGHFAACDVIGPAGRPVPLAALPDGTATAGYSLASILGCAAVRAIINDPRVLGIAEAYLGCKPTLSSVGVRWSFPALVPGHATQHFHRDPDDWRFLKLFVYLSDVDAQSGPHVFVRGSHHESGTVRARALSRDDVERRYLSGAVRMICGPAGTSFMADTHGIHAGMVPSAAPRLMLQAQYSLLPVFAFRYDPVALSAAECAGLDRHANRLLISIPA